MTQITNNHKFTKLSPEDVEFYEQVNAMVCASHALPFEIPVDAFFRIVVSSLKFFWAWYPDATQEQMLFIPYSDIMSAKKDSSANIDLLLPNGIEGVIDWKAANGSCGLKMNDYLRIALMQTYGNGGSMNSQPFSVSSSVISMYEVAQFKETFTRGIRANFNKNTSIFRLMTNIESGLVLQCMQRLQPAQLYGDYMFENYVIACVMEQLGRIVMSFDFKLPGNVTINYDDIKSQGTEQKKDLIEEIKDSNNNDIMMSK